MKEINFIDNKDYVLFLPTIYWRIILSYKKFNVSRHNFIGRILERIYKSYFSNSYSVWLEYFFYYRKEFNNYKDFLDIHYNLTDVELKSLNSITLRCSKRIRIAQYDYLLHVRSIREKLEDYLGGEFYI